MTEGRAAGVREARGAEAGSAWVLLGPKVRYGYGSCSQPLIGERNNDWDRAEDDLIKSNQSISDLILYLTQRNARFRSCSVWLVPGLVSVMCAPRVSRLSSVGTGHARADVKRCQDFVRA